MSDVLLSIRGLGVSYGRIAAVRGVDLEVHAGEVVGLLGPNGAGKSSVLAALMGTVDRSGEIRLDGVPLDGRAPEAVAAMGVSIVPEGRRLFSRLSVAENLRLGATARTGEPAAVEADIEELKGRFPILGERWNEPAAKLSGGQQQQLAIARALVARPRLLLMDEPSLGLDPKTVRRVFEVITELKDAGQSILLAEQNALRTTEVADRIYVLRTGTVARTGAAAELREELDYRAEYLGADVDEKDGGDSPDRKAGREDR